MNDKAGKYEGMDRFECREQLVKDLEAEGLVIKIEEHEHSVGHSERSGAVVEHIFQLYRSFCQIHP